MIYDPFLRKEFFEDKPWYNDFWIFHNIGVCETQDRYVAEIREALARFLLATRTTPGKEPGTTFIIGNGAIEPENMPAYIADIRGEIMPRIEGTPSCILDEKECAALAEIQARCDAATPGPWEVAENGTEIIHPTGEHWLDFYKRAHRSDGKIANNIGRARKDADAGLMAHAREDIPFLLGLIDRMRKYIVCKE